jgi:hypothetical protein
MAVITKSTDIYLINKTFSVKNTNKRILDSHVCSHITVRTFKKDTYVCVDICTHDKKFINIADSLNAGCASVVDIKYLSNMTKAFKKC